MERICNGDCNHNIPNNKCAKMAYLILAKLEIEYPDTYSMVQSHCPNLTCCPECGMDDFTHVEGCSIAKLLVKYELE